MESLDSSNHIHLVDDREISYEDLVQHEHAQKGKALERILQAKRERSGSNLSALDRVADRTPRVAIAELALDDDNSDDDDDDGEEGGDGANNDLRKALFEAIPEPYPHTLNYQRVIISDAGDPLDPDTRDACKKLKQCMAIREKWIGAHPFPPQDIVKDSPSQHLPDITSPERPVRNGSKKIKGDVDYRRRLPPTYEIFDVPLPPTIGHLRFKMVAGVVWVQSVAPTPPVTNDSQGDFAVGLSITTESSTEIPGHGQAATGQSKSVFEEEGSGEPGVEVIDWSTSLYPVPSFKEYVQDYTFVSSWLLDVLDETECGSVASRALVQCVVSGFILPRVVLLSDPYFACPLAVYPPRCARRSTRAT